MILAKKMILVCPASGSKFSLGEGTFWLISTYGGKNS